MNTVYLSRRNLLALLSKLDRNKEAKGVSQCTIIKRDKVHPLYPCSDGIQVTAVEDEEYYTDRLPGDVHPEDHPYLKPRYPHADEIEGNL